VLPYLDVWVNGRMRSRIVGLGVSSSQSTQAAMTLVSHGRKGRPTYIENRNAAQAVLTSWR
jgi:hypothetical protein